MTGAMGRVCLAVAMATAAGLGLEPSGRRGVPLRSLGRIRCASRSSYALTDGAGRRVECLELQDKVESRRTFVFGSASLVRVFETSFSEGKLGYSIWPASLAGAVWACERPELFDGKSVLELGSGVGCLGVAVAATTSAARVVLSDKDAQHDRDFDSPSGLVACQRVNIEANALEHVDARRVDWGDDRDWGEETFDVVLGADCVYCPEQGRKRGLQCHFNL